MIAQPARYIPFLQLPIEWSQAGGIPPEMALRNLCEWTVAGAFPSDALITRDGTPVQPLKVFEAFLAVSNNGSVYINGCSWRLEPYEAKSRLAGIIVESNDVAAFCAATHTLPPYSLLSGFRRIWSALRTKQHLAPPNCSYAMAHAVALHATESAHAILNSAERVIDTLEGRSNPFSVRLPENEPVDLNFWNAQWADYVEMAKKEIATSGQPTLTTRLAELEGKFRDAVAKLEQLGRIVSSPSEASTDAGKSLNISQLTIYLSSRTIVLSGREFLLPEQPFKLLCILAENGKKPGPGFVSNQVIEDRLWGSKLSDISRSVRDVVRDLRSILIDRSADTQQPNIVETRKGFGYRLTLSADDIEFKT